MAPVRSAVSCSSTCRKRIWPRPRAVAARRDLANGDTVSRNRPCTYCHGSHCRAFQAAIGQLVSRVGWHEQRDVPDLYSIDGHWPACHLPVGTAALRHCGTVALRHCGTARRRGRPWQVRSPGCWQVVFRPLFTLPNARTIPLSLSPLGTQSPLLALPSLEPSALIELPAGSALFRFKTLEPIPEVTIQVQGIGRVKRRSMMRIMAMRTKVAAVRA